MLAAAFAGRASEDVSAIVDSDRCVRCHSGVVDEVVTTSAGTLQVSHAEPHAAGMVCTACHQRIGHQGAVEPSMSQCLECHDSVIASAECSACHLVEPTGAAAVAEGRGAGSIIYQPVALDSGNCYGCHETESCDACHGLRLPHPVEYIQGGHAYDAAWEGKEQLCYQCHDPQECSLCHRSFSPASSHPPSFREEHKSLSRDASCYCHDQRRPPSQRGRPFCEACH